eukprot:Rhum_TRINITY_DN14384_c0_g1::Rhum_TRINITY_DN14384_c0_g1_i1::g.84964::m.84964/K11252/H2B; histone H2B
MVASPKKSGLKVSRASKAKDAKKDKKVSADGKKEKKVRRNFTNYSRFIHRLMRVQFTKKNKQEITSKGMGVVNSFVTDLFERLAGEASRVTTFSGAKTLSARSVVAAVKLQLPEELANHALASGTAAVGRYAKKTGRKTTLSKK